MTFDVGPQQEPSTESWSLLERRNGELYRATEIDCRIFVPSGFIPSEFRTDAFSQRWDWVERWMSEEQVVTEGLSLRWALASSEVGQPDVLISHDGCELGNHLVPLDPDTVFVHPCGLKLRCATSAAAAFEGGAIEELGALDSQVNRNWPGNDRVSGAVMDVLAMVTWNLTDSLRDLRQNWSLSLPSASRGDVVRLARPSPAGMFVTEERVRLRIKNGQAIATWGSLDNGTWAIVRLPSAPAAEPLDLIAPDGWTWVQVACKSESRYEHANLAPSLHRATIRHGDLDAQHWIQLRATRPDGTDATSPWIRGDSLSTRRTLWLAPGDQRLIAPDTFTPSTIPHDPRNFDPPPRFVLRHQERRLAATASHATRIRGRLRFAQHAE